MKCRIYSKGKYCLFLITLLLLVYSGSAQAQGMGAYFWGDADGNGDIGTPDVSSLNAILNNPAASDTVYYTKYPVSRYRQDTDGNGDIGAPDAAILRAWLYGDFSTISGGAGTLLLEATTTHVQTGSSVLVGAHALSGSGSLALRTGWGVEFAIAATSPCQTAEIYGYTATGGDTTAGYGWWRHAYKYTPQPFAPDNAIARVKVRPTGCSMGQHIYIKVFIPSDAHAVIPGARFPNDLNASQGNVDVAVSPPPCQRVTAIDAKPDNPLMTEGTTISFRGTCTLADSSTVNCTSSYCGVNTAWTVSGDLTQLSPPNLIQANWDGFSGTVTATYNDGVNTPVSDTSNVTVRDFPPDTSITSHPANPASSTSATFAFTSTEPVPPGTFDCSLDGAGWAPCSSPKIYSGLGEGAHNFKVRAIDGGGRFDPSPASFDWTIDTIPPVTNLISTPPLYSASTSADFTFDCTDASLPCTFQCHLDADVWAACTSPKNYTGLSQGAHTFQVIATDAAGNMGSSAATYSWMIDTTPPTIPGNLHVVASGPNWIRLSWDASTDNVGVAGYFVYRFGGLIDSTALTTYTNTGLVPGQNYCYTVKAYDASNNISGESNQACATTPLSGEFPIANTPSEEFEAGAAFGSTNFMVGIKTSTGANSSDIGAQLVAQSGAPIGSLVSVMSGVRYGDPAGDLAFDGANYLLVWANGYNGCPTACDKCTNYEIRGQFLTKAGAKVGSSFLITNSSSAGLMVAGIAYGGGKYLVDYYVETGSATTVNGRLITPAGVVGSEFTISNAWDNFGATRNLAFDGTNFLAIGVDKATTLNVKGRFVSPSTGPFGSEITINTSTNPSGNPVAIAFDGANYLVLWTEEIGGSGTHQWDVFGQRVSPAGAKVGGKITICNDPGQQFLPMAAFDGTNYLVTWMDMKNDTDLDMACDPGENTCADINGRFFNTSGAPVGAEFPVEASSGNEFGGVMAYGAGKYLVVITTFSHIGPLNGNPHGIDVYGKFIMPVGGPDPTPPSIPSGVTAAEGDLAVNLSWTPSTDNVEVTGYQVSVGATVMAKVTETNFSHTGLISNKQYCYTVKAFDWAGNVSADSSPPACATPTASLNVRGLMKDQAGSTVQSGQPIMIFTDNIPAGGPSISVEFRNTPAGSWTAATNVFPLFKHSLVGCNVPSLGVGNAELRVTINSKVSNTYPIRVSGIWPPGPYTVTGRITSGGSGVDSAWIGALQNMSGHGNPDYFNGAITDSSGYYSLLLYGGTYMFYAGKEGGRYLESGLQTRITGSIVLPDIDLGQGVIFAGYVVDDIDNSIHLGGGTLQLGSNTNNFEGAVFSDGSFSIAVVAGDDYYGRLSMYPKLLYPGGEGDIGVISSDMTNMLILITKGVKFETYVANTHCQLVPGINVYFGNQWGNETVTDSNGYIMVPAYPGTSDLNFEPSDISLGYVGSNIWQYDMPSSGENFGTATVYDGFLVWGHVQDTSGDPIAARFQSSYQPGPPPYSDLGMSVDLDDSGDFFARAFGGYNFLTVDFHDYNQNYGTKFINIQDYRNITADTNLGTYIAVQGISFTGHVQDRNSNPVTDVDVYCMGAVHGQVEDYLNPPRSDFNIIAYPSENYDCYVWDNAYMQQTTYLGNPVNCSSDCSLGNITLTYRP